MFGRIKDELVSSLRRCDIGWIWLPRFDWRQQIFTLNQNLSPSIDRNPAVIFNMHFQNNDQCLVKYCRCHMILKTVRKWIANVEMPYHCLLDRKNAIIFLLWKGHLTFSAKDKTLFWFAASLYICDPNFDIKANNILVKQRICSSKKAEYHPLSRCWVVLSFRSGLVTGYVLSLH